MTLKKTQAAHKSDGNQLAGRGGNGRFAAGHKLARGRKPGVPNRSTLLGKELIEALMLGGEGLPSARERWKKILEDESPDVRLRAEMFLHRARFGMPSGGEESSVVPLSVVVTYVNGWRPGPRSGAAQAEADAIDTPESE